MESQISAFLPKYLHQEEVVAQEFKDLIFSLPKENGWVASYLYKYQGFWHPVRHLQGIITCQRHFQARDSDVILITTPKSGTTWLKAIVFTLMNRMQCPINQDHPLLSKNPHELVPFLEHRLYVDNQIPDLSSVNSPRLFATHIPFFSLPKSMLDSGCKLVYLCRNPKDTFVSLWQFCNKLRPREIGTHSPGETFDMFCRGASMAGPFWDHVLDYWKESRENPHKANSSLLQYTQTDCLVRHIEDATLVHSFTNYLTHYSHEVLFLKYDDIKENPTVNLRCLAEFLGCPFTNEEEESGMVEEILKLCSFGNLSNLEIYRTGKLSSGEENKAFFRQGKVGDWKNHLTIDMVEKLDQITEQKLSGSGLVL